MKAFIWLLLLCLMLISAGCSGVKFNPHRQISGIEQIDFLPTDTAFSKALFDPLSGSIYALEKQTAMVHVFRDGKLQNRIGGIGFDSYNFQRLSDIALDTDGGLLALDPMAKSLKKFTPDGQLMSRMDLSMLAQPELIASSPDQDLFVYDAAPQEIVCVSALDASELNRFGKFESLLPTNLYCTRDYVVAYDSSRDLSHVFHILGQHKENMPRQIIFDAFANVIVADAVDIPEGFVATRLPVAIAPGICTMNRDHICAIMPSGISIYRVSYQRGTR